MKILAVSHLFPNEHEDRYGIFVARQLHAMAQEGAEIDLLVPRLYSPPWLNRLIGRPKRSSYQSSLKQVEGVHGRSVTYFSWPGRSFKRRAGKAMYRAIVGIAETLHRTQQFDIVYGTDWFLGGQAAYLLGQSLGIPSACLAIGDDINITAKQSGSDHQRFAAIANGLTTTLACGESLATQIDAVRHGKNNTLNVYGVVDLDRFQPLSISNRARMRKEKGWAADELILLYVGYLWRRKGLLELVSAAASLGEEFPVKLVICGAGEDEVAIRNAARESPFADKIRFTGSVAPDEIHSWMQAADVLVLPSYSEGMPNAVMEAMACGLPIVCSRVGGLPDALHGCDGAVLVEPRDSEGLAAGLRAVLADQEKRNSMGEASRQLAIRQFGARGNAQRILTHFRDALHAAGET